MTTAEIITAHAIELKKAGIINGCGMFATINDENGNTVDFELPEAIHTFAVWKQLGFMVKRGEHAVAKFLIWKPVSRRAADDEDAGEDTEAGTKMIKVKAYFFAAHQVQPMKA